MKHVCHALFHMVYHVHSLARQSQQRGLRTAPRCFGERGYSLLVYINLFPLRRWTWNSLAVSTCRETTKDITPLVASACSFAVCLGVKPGALMMSKPITTCERVYHVLVHNSNCFMLYNGSVRRCLRFSSFWSFLTCLLFLLTGTGSPMFLPKRLSYTNKRATP